MNKIVLFTVEYESTKKRGKMWSSVQSQIGAMKDRKTVEWQITENRDLGMMVFIDLWVLDSIFHHKLIPL